MGNEGEEGQGLQLCDPPRILYFAKMCLFLGSPFESVNSEGDRMVVIVIKIHYSLG